MPVPSVSKTYQFDVNNVVPSQAETPFHQTLLLGIKDAMIGFATLPWTVISSSDSAIAGAGDNWTVIGDLVWNTSGNVHSWIVLQQGAGGGQLCIDLNFSSSQSEKANFFWSAGGNFTGGTTTNRPTATDEINAMGINQTNSYYAANQQTTPAQNVYQVMHSTDGRVDRVIILSGGVAHSVWRFEQLENPRAAHTNNPTIVGIQSSGNVANELVALNLRTAGANSYLKTEKDGSGTDINLVAASLHAGSGFLALEDVDVSNVVEEWDNETWPTREHVVCKDIGSRGPKGSAIDSWLGQTGINVTGDTMPNSTTVREFVAWGPYVWPWTGDATIPQVS